jgi:hypothetical protein
MQAVRSDLEAWGKAATGALSEWMRQPVLLTAITPSKQNMSSSVGREVCHHKLWIDSSYGSVHFMRFIISQCFEQSLYQSWELTCQQNLEPLPRPYCKSQ